MPRDVPLKTPFRFGAVALDALRYAWVRIETTAGLVGYGECPAYGDPTGETQLGAIGAVNEIEPQLVGLNAADIEGALAVFDRYVPGALAARCGIDAALHDLLGQSVGAPVHVLLGGDRSTIPVNAVLGLPARTDAPSLDEIAARGVEKLRNGYPVLKIKVGVDLQAECELVAKVRRDAPPESILFVDANQAWGDAKSAIAACRALHRAGASWIEQPVLARDLNGLRRVTDATDASVIADESVLTPADALAIARLGAADMINIKLAKTGGLRAARDVLAIARAANMPCVLGSMVEGALGMLANYHLARAHEFVTCGFSVYADVIDDIDVGLSLHPGGLTKADSLPGLGYPDATPFEAAFARS